jgi:long-subunit fatty acid transport protein
MGFAHIGVVEDGSALFYNPAGLAQVRRVEISGGLFHDSQDREVSFPRVDLDDFPAAVPNTRDADVGATQIGHLSLVYPFPTYRGSLVLGLAYQRVASLDSDYFRRAFLRMPSGGTPGLLETESFTEDGSVNFWTAGLAGDVSPNIALGGSLTFIEGGTRQEFQIGRLRAFSNGNTDVNESEEVFLLDDFRDADLTGYTGSVGALARLGEMTRLGLTVDFPQRYNFDGRQQVRLEDQEKIDCFGFPRSEGCPDPGPPLPFEDTITLPFSFGAGLSVSPRNLLLAADVRLTDWTRIDFEGEIETRDRENAYRSTAEINLGIEYQFDFHPTRIRAGFSSQPLPYKLVPDEIDFTFVPDDGDPNTTDDTSFFTRIYPEAGFETDRRFLTLGAGTLVDNAVSLDVAYVHGMYERTGNAVSEKWTTDRIFGTATIRF